MALSAPTPSVTDFGSLAALKTSARANDPESVRKAAQQFEALFLQQMLKAARASSLGDDVLGGGQTGFYQDMFDQQMALHLSSGGGFGLADMLVRQLTDAHGGAAAANAGAGAQLNPFPGRSAIRAILPQVSALAQQARAAASAASSATTASASATAGTDVATGLGSDPESFIAQIRPHAERAARTLGVPAEVIMAQAALETGWGRAVPQDAAGRSSFNLFGIKATPGWDGGRLVKTTHEHLGGRMHKVSAEFRSYDSVGDAFDDYARFLQSNPRYAEALREGDDAAGFAQGLQDAGYATDPAYADKLLKLIRSQSISRSGAPTATDGSA